MIEWLREWGLSAKEAEIYSILAKSEEITANDLAKQSSSNRTVIYNILQQLVDKGLVCYVHKKGKRFFSITDPESLLVKIKEKEGVARDLMQSIRRIKKATQQTRKVEVFEGIEGVKIVFEEIRAAKNLRILNATGRIYQYLKYSAKHVAKDIAKKKQLWTIGTHAMKKTPLNKLGHIGSRRKFLPREADNYATTFIFDGKVIIQVLKDKPFSIRIENKDVYEGYKKDFDVLWSKL